MSNDKLILKHLKNIKPFKTISLEASNYNLQLLDELFNNIKDELDNLKDESKELKQILKNIKNKSLSKKEANKQIKNIEKKIKINIEKNMDSDDTKIKYLLDKRLSELLKILLTNYIV